MRKVIVILLVFQCFLLNAQEPPKMLKYNAKNSANLFYYQLEEIPKKIKVKDEGLANTTRKALRDYNNKIKNLSFLNFQKLRDLETMVNSLGSQLRTNPELGMRVRKNIESTILPIRDSVAVYEKDLNGFLKESLSKKQYKKWVKYQKKEKRKLLPEQPKNRSAAQPSNMNRRRGGMGRRNGGF